MTTLTGAAAQKQMDADSRAIIYDGASVSQLGRLFGMDNRTVAEKIQGLEPVGTRAGYSIYSVAQAATRLAPMAEEEIERRLRTMNPKDLPKMISKEFWAGLTARRRYEHQAGELWSTDEVMTAAMAAFKVLRTTLLLLPEQIAQQAGLDDTQREKVQRVVDSTMEDMRARLGRQFTRQSAPRGVEPEDGDL